MAALLRSNPPLRRLLAAWLQSCVGTGAGYVALLLLTTRHLHTAWALAAVLLADFLPGIALGPVFGVLADRYSRRVLIVAANLLQAAAWTALAFAHTATSIIGLALLAGFGNALLRPAIRSALPVLAGESIQIAVAVYDLCGWVGLTAGSFVAAILFAVSGVALPLALNGFSFLIAAAVMATVAIASGAHAERREKGDGSGLRAGLAVALDARGTATVIACGAGAIIAGGLLNVSTPLLATKVLHGSGSDYALLVACYGVGMVTASALVTGRGSVAAGVLVRRYLDAQILIAVSLFASAVVGSVLPAAVAFVGTGYANALLLVSETQLIQLRVPGAVQGRLFGAKDTLDGVCFLLGLLAAGALAATLGVRVAIAAGAGICAVCALVATASLRFGRARPASATAVGPSH